MFTLSVAMLFHTSAQLRHSGAKQDEFQWLIPPMVREIRTRVRGGSECVTDSIAAFVPVLVLSLTPVLPFTGIGTGSGVTLPDNS